MTQIPIGLASQGLVLVGGPEGRALISADTPLRRLNYFDGKFLRAEHLRQEQTYLRSLVAHSNQAGGAGVVHGFDVGRSGDRLTLGPGLAIDPQGRVLLLSSDESVSITELIEGTRRIQKVVFPTAFKPDFDECELVRADVAVDALVRPELWLVSIAHAEALCGEEDVYGRLCEEACVTETARPYLLEGVVLRIRPLSLAIDYKRTGAVALKTQPHLRSLAASAYFALEAAQVPTQISGAGLRDGPWCAGADAAGGIDVPIAVLGRRGSANLFLDPWIVRRERMEPPPRRYWGWRMNMRPWDVFLAQVLQFQCQLMGLLRRTKGTDGGEPMCQDEQDVLRETAESIKWLKIWMGGLAEADRRALYTGAPMAGMLETALLPGATAAAAAGATGKLLPQFDRVFRLDETVRDLLRGRKVSRSARILIDGGIVELPPAGYLPVDPALVEPIESQVRRYMGAGVALRFCVAPADHLAHLFEEAQHMTRIDLLTGLDNPKRRARVEIFVPDGRFEEVRVPPVLNGFRVGLGAIKLVTQEGEFFPQPATAAERAEFAELEVAGAGAGGAAAGGAGAAAGAPAFGPGAGPAIRGLARARILTEADESVGRLFSTGVRLDLGATLTQANLRSRALGAGRGELLPTGGGLFYMAGTAPSGDGRDVLVRSLEAALVGMGAPTAAAAGGAGGAAEPRTVEVEAEEIELEARPDGISFVENVMRNARDLLREDTPELFGRAARATARTTRAARGRAARDTAAPAAAAMRMVEIDRFAYRNVPPYLVNVLEKETGSGFWSKARITRNPFQLTPGRNTDFELRLTLARGASKAATGPGVTELVITGTLTVSSAPVVAGAITTITAELDGRMRVEIMQPNGTSICFGRPMKQTVRLERFDDGGQDAVRVRMGSAAGSLVVLAHWPGSVLGVDAEVLVGIETNGFVMYMGALALDRDNSVFDPANVYHRAAVSALELIAVAKREPAFAPRETANLFRPTAAAGVRRRIRTQRDWVLFRRWREIDCGGVVTVAPPKPRTYMSYLVTLDTVRMKKYGAAIPKVLRETPDRIPQLVDALMQVPAKRVGPVEFESEGSRVTSDLVAYQLAYQAQGPGKQLYLGAIGSRGEATQDPETLAKARVTTLGGALKDVSRLPAYDPFVLFGGLTDRLSPESTDGVVLLVTDSAAKATALELLTTKSYVTADVIAAWETDKFATRGGGLEDPFAPVRFVNGEIVQSSLDPVLTGLPTLYGPRSYAELRVYGRSAAEETARMGEAAEVARQIGVSAKWQEIPRLQTSADGVMLLVLQG